MLRNTNTLPAIAVTPASLDDVSLLRSQFGARSPMIGSSLSGRGSNKRSPSQVASSASDTVGRQTIAGRGITAEIVQSTSRNRIEFRYRGPWHLLVAYEQGVRREGETFVDGAPLSTLRDLTRKLTFVPAGHDYFERHQLHTSGRLLFVYFDPAGLDVRAPPTPSNSALNPRLLFENAALWSTVAKLKGLIEREGAAGESLPYFEALGRVLMHELVRLNGAAGKGETLARGGLAAWQQRMASAYIEEHLCERISLATLARLARLSPYHFSRAFKQSFGVPPHRYHTNRRIERAKALLERHALSVTDIGLTLGFSETSSFTAAFRKTTGLTPSRYHRSITDLPAELSGVGPQDCPELRMTDTDSV